MILCASDNYVSFEALKLLAKKVRVAKIIVNEPLKKEVLDFCRQEGVLICNKMDTVNRVGVLISFSYKKLIDKSLINKARVAVNFHPAPLPFYRGRATTMQALIKGEKRWGATFHYLAEKFDSGKIIERRWFDISEHCCPLKISESSLKLL